MAAAGKSFEVRIADLVRLLGSEFERPVLNVHGALKRLLASRSVGFTDLGNAIEKLATGGLEAAEMQRLYYAGYQRALKDSVRRQAEEQAIYGQRLDGSTDWELIATFVNAKRRVSTLSIINSSTTWPRAWPGAASRPKSRASTCSVCSGRSAGGSGDDGRG